MTRKKTEIKPETEIVEQEETKEFRVSISDKYMRFVPGPNKNETLINWLNENDIKFRFDEDWIFTNQKDADLFHQAWAVR